MFAKLVVYKHRYNTTDVSRQYEEDPQLGRWVGTQRVRHRKNNMLSYRQDLLNSIDFAWDSSASEHDKECECAHWMAMFAKLVVYKHRHHTTAIPTNYKEDPQLRRWMLEQRAMHKKNKILFYRRDMMNSINFVWDFSKQEQECYRAQWMAMFAKLVAYKHRHNNTTTVPQCYKEDPLLGRWVAEQRRKIRKNRLLSFHRDMLNSIDFAWDNNYVKNEKDCALWMHRFQQVVAYKKKHETTMVPCSYKDGTLGRWVQKQRRQLRHRLLPDNRRTLLDSIDFVWDGYEGRHTLLWVNMFQKLVQYKKLYNDTMVPNRWEEDRQLSRWVNYQRYQHKKGKLCKEWCDFLDSLGFVWDTGTTSAKARPDV